MDLVAISFQRSRTICLILVEDFIGKIISNLGLWFSKCL